jgi:hypothetical protein
MVQWTTLACSPIVSNRARSLSDIAFVLGEGDATGCEAAGPILTIVSRFTVLGRGLRTTQMAEDRAPQ